MYIYIYIIYIIYITTLAQVFKSDLRPPGWQADAFVTNLHNASCGMLQGLENHSTAILAKFVAIVGGESAGGRKSQQGAFNQFLTTVTPPCWPVTLMRKLDSLDSLDDFDISLSTERIKHLSSCLCKLGPRVAMAVVKSWANAWTTSLRMHEPLLLPCIFGCPGSQDELDHYIVCEPLWTAVISCSFKQTELLQSSPFTKLGLDGSMAWLQMLAIAFSCYHAIKLSHRDCILASIASGHPCQVLDRLVEYARFFSNELLCDP